MYIVSNDLDVINYDYVVKKEEKITVLKETLEYLETKPQVNYSPDDVTKDYLQGI